MHSAIIEIITGMANSIIRTQLIGFLSFGFSARNTRPSDVSRAASTPPPSTYAPFTNPLRSSVRTHTAKICAGNESGQSLPVEIRRSTFLSFLLSLIFPCREFSKLFQSLLDIFQIFLMKGVVKGLVVCDKLT